MSDPTAAPVPYLEAALAQNLGSLTLQVDCTLTAPWTVLFGPSGAGKTSILRLLAGLAEPRRGLVVLRGRVLVDTEGGVSAPAGKRRIGYVSRRPSLFPHMDVAANVGFGLAALAARDRRERVARMLDLFHAEPLAGRKPSRLSGGEQQRVALARALAPEPEMLLLDEPFSGLDAPLKESILRALTSWLDARKIPALYVSHDLAEVFQTGAEVIVLRNGRIEAHGAAHAVLAGERERLLRQLDLPNGFPPD